MYEAQGTQQCVKNPFISPQTGKTNNVSFRETHPCSKPVSCGRQERPTSGEPEGGEGTGESLGTLTALVMVFVLLSWVVGTQMFIVSFFFKLFVL